MDRYVLDTLLGDLVGHDRSASSFLVYLWLWAQAGGGGKLASVEASLRDITEGTGLSKRAVQMALARLRDRRLLASEQATRTSTPVYTLATPWRR